MIMPRTVRVLLADGSHIVTESLSIRINGEEGISVVAAVRSAAELIQMAREAQPDVILINVHLPGMDGADCVTELRAALPEVPIIVFTIYDLVMTRIVFLEAGANAVVQGNHLADRLVREIRRLCTK
jgi:two-component system, NarL family, nitrate/nitrite response regulator NarL